MTKNKTQLKIDNLFQGRKVFKKASLGRIVISVLIALLVLGVMFYSNASMAENIKVKTDGEGMTNILTGLSKSATLLLNNLLNEGTTTRAVILLLWQFFFFIMLVYLLIKWAWFQAEMFEILTFGIFALCAYAFMLVPVFGSPSAFAYLGANLINGLYLFSNALLADGIGLPDKTNGYVAIFEFYAGLATKLDYETTGSWWFSIVLGIVFIVLLLVLIIFLTLVTLIDIIAYLSLTITFIFGAFFIILSFFNFGMSLTMNWISICLGWTFTMFIGKIVVGLSAVTWALYFGIPVGEMTGGFWVTNTLTLTLARVGDLSNMIFLTILFIFPLWQSIGWGQSLASASLVNPGRVLGVAALAKRLL